ncbi:unnamed protein product [Ceratitis capitata]|uniref:(Mediterranean fruit fly) hypothetical protein n=1 Tax=Ceratitis capitata TaxID=7213 RepID=A0A811VB40_CERCA|nr:unnamed protein product [Ceratitis capitata]
MDFSKYRILLTKFITDGVDFKEVKLKKSTTTLYKGKLYEDSTKWSEKVVTHYGQHAMYTSLNMPQRRNCAQQIVATMLVATSCGHGTLSSNKR